MRLKSERFKIFVYIALLFFLFPSHTYAYLDPGTGSYLFQILIAGFFSSLFFAKAIVRKAKRFLTTKFKKNAERRESTTG